MEAAKKTHLKKSTRALLICLALLICVSILNWAIVSNGGDVKIRRINILGTDGLTYSALMYVPSNATDATPAPAIIMYHGGAGNARNHESWSVEFARRGYVCLAIDWNGSGESEAYKTGTHTDVWDVYSNVPEMWLKYLMDIPCVDTDNIMTAGHSMGVRPAAKYANKYNLKAALLASGAGMVASAEDSSISGEFLKGYEGAVLMTLGSADIDSVDTAIQYMNFAAADMGFIDEGENVSMNSVYGDFESGKVLQLSRIPEQVHEAAFISTNTIGTLLEFAQKVVKPVNYIDSVNQIWFWKDVVGQIGMILLVCTMIALYLFLIDEMPVLACLKQPLPRNIGLRGVGLIIAVIASIGFPLLCIKTGSLGLLSVLNNSKLFAMGHANKALAFVAGTAFFGLIMLCLFWFTDAKKANANLYDMGLGSYVTGKIDIKMIGKAFVTAIVVVAAGWTYVSTQTSVLGTDFYCLFWGYKPFSVEKMTHYIPYVICWIPCFVVAGLGINIEKRLPSTGKEALDTAIAIVVNVILSAFTVTFIVLLQQHLQLAADGTIDGQAMSTWKLDITRLYGMPVGVSIGTAGNTYLYRKTGNIWPGVFLMAIVCSLSAVLYGQFRIV